MTALERDGLSLSDDHALLDVDLVARWIGDESYWAEGRSRATIERSIERSHCFAVYEDSRQIAFSRVVTDEATFAWLCDVFVDEQFRARGIGRWMVSSAVEWCQDLGVQRVVLATRDAHGVYEGVGFEPLAHPDRWMIIDTRPPRQGFLE